MFTTFERTWTKMALTNYYHPADMKTKCVWNFHGYFLICPCRWACSMLKISGEDQQDTMYRVQSATLTL